MTTLQKSRLNKSHLSIGIGSYNSFRFLKVNYTLNFSIYIALFVVISGVFFLKGLIMYVFNLIWLIPKERLCRSKN